MPKNVNPIIMSNVRTYEKNYIGGDKMREKTRVLLADDNQEFSKTLTTYINNQEDMLSAAIILQGYMESHPQG